MASADPPAGTDFVAIAAGYEHSLALRTDGSIVGWGSNNYGQADPPAGTDFVAIAAGYEYSLALRTDNSVIGWGRNYEGQADPPAGTDFVAIAAGYEHSLAIKQDGQPVILTMQTEPVFVDTVTPQPGEHEYALGIVVNICAERFVDCPDVYIFDHWEGDVNDPNSASTTIVMDANQTVTAVFVDGRECGDECHPYPEGDLNKDCKVNFFDIAVVANTWLECTDPNCD